MHDLCDAGVSHLQPAGVLLGRVIPRRHDHGVRRNRLSVSLAPSMPGQFSFSDHCMQLTRQHLVGESQPITLNTAWADRLLICCSCGTADAKGASSKPKKLLSRHKGNAKELTGIPGWVAKKYRSLKHAARGTFNRPMKVCNICGCHSWVGVHHTAAMRACVHRRNLHTITHTYKPLCLVLECVCTPALQLSHPNYVSSLNIYVCGPCPCVPGGGGAVFDQHGAHTSHPVVCLHRYVPTYVCMHMCC